MKKFICRFTIAFAMVAILLSSCMKEKEGTFIYTFQLYGTVQDEDAKETLVDYFTHVCGGYFVTEHSYTGLASETVDRAVQEFAQRCEEVSSTYVESYLSYGEQVIIYLVEKDSGTAVAWYGWVNENAAPEDDE